MTAANLAVRPPAFIIHQDSVGWVGEPYRPVGADNDIIWGVEFPALEPVGEHRHRSIMPGPGHAPGKMLAGDKPPLPVDAIAIRVLRWLAKHRYRPISVVESHHPVVRDIGPDEIAAGGKPGRTLAPAPARPQPFDMGVEQDAVGEFRPDDLEPGTLDNAEHNGLPFLL